MSPNTHGDSLGYHFTVANSILENGVYPLDITHIHTLLSGSGELLIAVGLLFGSEQFGGLIQFSGLLSILGIFKKINHQKNYYFLLLLLTTPIIIFLCSTAKPQLFHICSSAVIFAMYFINKENKLNNDERIIRVFISLTILLVSVTSKFTFIVSGTLLGSYILYSAYVEKNLRYFFAISLSLFFLFYFPIIYVKYLKFGGSLFQYFLSPLPTHLSGMKEFQNYLFRFGRHLDYYSIIFPISIKQFTNSIGIAFLYLLFFNFKNKFSKITFVIVIVYLVIHYFYGQFIGRTFMEPLFWILMIMASYGVSSKFKLFEYLFRIQSFVVICGIFVGIYFLLPASTTKFQKEKVLSSHANGYSLFKWANTKLKASDNVLSYHRSISLGHSNYISMDYTPYVNLKDKKNFMYLDKLAKKKPEFLLTYSYPNYSPSLSIFKNCVGKLLHFEKNVGRFETRNPFNRGHIYSGYIYEFKFENFPDCLVKPSEI